MLNDMDRGKGLQAAPAAQAGKGVDYLQMMKTSTMDSMEDKAKELRSQLKSITQGNWYRALDRRLQVNTRRWVLTLRVPSKLRLTRIP